MESKKRLKTKKIIEEAMIKLLKEQSFDQITTVKLTKTAGISRSSFYTHYKDKYDMIERYQEKLFSLLETILNPTNTDKHQAIAQVFTLLTQEPLLASLLSKNGICEIHNFLRQKLQIILSQGFQQRYKALNSAEKEYSAVYLTNAIFGVCQMWLANGSKESPEEMADFLIKMLH